MADPPDEVQREFEAGLHRNKLFSICLVRRGIEYRIDNHAMEKVERVVEKWRRRIAKAKPVDRAHCLTCDTDFSRLAHEPEAYAVALPTAKKDVSGRTVSLIAGFCAKCSTRSDDELIEIARKHWAPTSVPLSEGNA